MSLQPFPVIERALRSLLISELGLTTSEVGGDLDYARGDGRYVRIVRAPGGRAGQTEGTFALDVEVFGDVFTLAGELASRIEALLLDYPHRILDGETLWVFDSVYQNAGPRLLPWDDEAVYRIGATYAITARRRA